MRIKLAISSLLILAACSTPRTVLIDPVTKQAKACGGGYGGSVIGGITGYRMQKNSDKKCVEELQSQGYIIHSVQSVKGYE